MKLNIIEVFDTLNKAQSVISPIVGTHQQRVSYLAYALAEKLGFSSEQKYKIYMAGIIHDIGALSIKEKLDAIEGSGDDIHVHGHRGAHLISEYDTRIDLAPILYYHHYPWEYGKAVETYPDMPMESHLIHLADRVCTLTADYTDAYILTSISEVRQYVEENKGLHFYPEYVEALVELTGTESVWLDLVSSETFRKIDLSDKAYIDITSDELVNLACVFSYLIDFRSQFTATHSSGVAKTAEKLAELMHFSPDECKKMLAAGYLHDLGKLTIDIPVLEKQAALEPSEYEYIKSHVYYTYHLLNGISGLDDIKIWASYHHEKLNGKGYPFHISGDSISLCARIMAVADVFAALREKRPYKEPFTKEKILSILDNLVENGSIDGNVVAVIAENYELIEETCVNAQEQARQTYDRVYQIT
jgi:HD-GYP domain-containing protein (c-di-GMP phosphodiesterase class II)